MINAQVFFKIAVENVSACNFAKSSTPPWVFFTFLKNVQIIIKFQIKLGKIKLLITFDRQMIPTKLFTSSLSSKEQTTDVNIFIDDVTIWKKPKSKLITYLARRSASAFGFHEVRSTTLMPFLSTFTIWNQLNKSCFQQELWLFENGIKIFKFLTKNADVRKIMWTCTIKRYGPRANTLLGRTQTVKSMGQIELKKWLSAG